MAQKVHVLLVDDVDGGDADENVQFALDGISYEIDLSEANAKLLREALATWVEHARRAGAPEPTGRGRRAKSDGQPAEKRPAQDLSDVRAWARENGYEVSERGRIKAEIKAAYEAAH